LTIEQVIDASGGTMASSAVTTRKKRTDCYLFEDLVEEFYECLEKLIDFQNKAAGHNGVRIKATLREHLEGWDFTDIAHGHDAHPRVATLNVKGWGWVNFVRSINAIVLLGRGFGDLIRPRTPSDICSNWQTLPSGHSYLAATVSDLNNITKLHGNRWIKPPQLVQGLVWHSPIAPFTTCPCQASSKISQSNKTTSRHACPVQVLSPPGFRKAETFASVSALPNESAVIFGHNISWKYKWRNNGADDELDKDNSLDNDVPLVLQTSNALSASMSTASRPSDQATNSPGIELSKLSTPPTSVSTISNGDTVSPVSSPISSSAPQPAIAIKLGTEINVGLLERHVAGWKAKRRSMFSSIADRLRGRTTQP
jgi:hypothetical protein